MSNLVFVITSTIALYFSHVMLNMFLSEKAWILWSTETRQNIVLPWCEYECASSVRHFYWILFHSTGTDRDAHLQIKEAPTSVSNK